MGKPPGPTHAVARDALEAYKQARLAFVNALNEMLRKDDPSLDAALLDGECLALLHRPLVQDIVPGIQTSALAAMRALASRVDRAGDVLATPETLKKIVSSLSHADPNVVVAGCGVARALASKREAHVRALFDAGALPPLREALDSLNPEILDAAAKCAVAVAQASPWAAERMLDSPPPPASSPETEEKENRRVFATPSDASELSTAAVHEKRVTSEKHKQSGGKKEAVRGKGHSLLECLCSVSSDAKTSLATRATIARFFEACAAHGEALASRVVRDADCAGAVTRLARDAGLALAAGAGAVRARATAFAAAAEMARHADALALAVRDAGIVPDALLGCCETNDLFVPEAAATREAATACLRALASKTPELAESLIEAGAAASLTDSLSLEKGGKRAALAAQTLGFLADYKPSTAAAVCGADGGRALVRCLERAETGDVAAAAAWALGCVARHGTNTASVLAKNGAIRALLSCYAGVQADRHLTLREKAKASLKALIKKCGGLETIDALVSAETPGPILRHVLAEFAERLGKDVAAKRAFVTSGGLMRLQGVLRAHDKDVAAAAAAAKAAAKGDVAGAAVTSFSTSSAAIGLSRPLLDERALRDAKKINSVFPPDVVSYYLYC
jgi:hypothetical protein